MLALLFITVPDAGVVKPLITPISARRLASAVMPESGSSLISSAYACPE